MILGKNGQKLSKQNLAPALPEQEDAVRPLLHRALIALDQSPPSALATESARTQLEWAVTHWSPQRLQPTAERHAPDTAQR